MSFPSKAQHQLLLPPIEGSVDLITGEYYHEVVDTYRLVVNISRQLQGDESVFRGGLNTAQRGSEQERLTCFRFYCFILSFVYFSIE